MLIYTYMLIQYYAQKVTYILTKLSYRSRLDFATGLVSVCVCVCMCVVHKYY